MLGKDQSQPVVGTLAQKDDAQIPQQIEELHDHATASNTTGTHL